MRKFKKFQLSKVYGKEKTFCDGEFNEQLFYPQQDKNILNLMEIC